MVMRVVLARIKSGKGALQEPTCMQQHIACPALHTVRRIDPLFFDKAAGTWSGLEGHPARRVSGCSWDGTAHAPVQIYN